jgi:uncharacterized protein YyaL (SSP411 family)
MIIYNMSNRLKNQSSPYLLQHAENPVDWYPWSDEALEKAKLENKLILVSTGYSACHWCHVMEHESFEDSEVAEIMNRHFVCIKVDREVRPDIDQIYMSAVQLMTGSGGWPLNCFCLPDQRPIYGGTYFRKNDWKSLLQNLAGFWREKPDEAVAYAVRLTEGVNQTEQLIPVKDDVVFNKSDLEAIFNNWKRTFDLVDGGYNRAPKFPLPNNWQFMLRYAHLMKDDAAHVAVRITLQKMAFGGIYDQIGGGFARYSVDGKWHVPHFEKMLYDNAQLVSLYSEAYQYTPDPIYKNIVYQSLDFVERELTSSENGFYSALDADSEGVEGKFYTFTRDEIKAALNEDEELFCIYYQITAEGNWEEEKTNILMRGMEDSELAAQLGLSLTELSSKISEANKKLLAARSKRIRPGLDYKILASWNGMMLKAYTDAYRVFGEPEFLAKAKLSADFIQNKLIVGKEIRRVYSSENSSDEWAGAFLDDYAFVIDSLIGLYEVSFDERVLFKAKELTDYSISEFHDKESGMFFYTPNSGEQLIARKQEIMDNVIPSSNSVMAYNLYKLGHFFVEQNYLDISLNMLRNVQPHIKSYGSAYSNWAILLLNNVFGIYEIVITGMGSEEKRMEMEKYYIPNKILLGGTSGTLPLLKDKFESETKIFVCRNKTCLMPVKEALDAFKQIDKPNTMPGGKD